MSQWMNGSLGGWLGGWELDGWDELDSNINHNT